MWKSIIIITSLLVAMGSANTYAAGIESMKRETHQDRVDRNEIFNERMSFNEMMGSFNLSEDVSTGIIFGLDREDRPSHEGPRDESKGMGIGIGFSLSF